MRRVSLFRRNPKGSPAEIERNISSSRWRVCSEWLSMQAARIGVGVWVQERVVKGQGQTDERIQLC